MTKIVKSGQGMVRSASVDVKLKKGVFKLNAHQLRKFVAAIKEDMIDTDAAIIDLEHSFIAKILGLAELIKKEDAETIFLYLSMEGALDFNTNPGELKDSLLEELNAKGAPITGGEIVKVSRKPTHSLSMSEEEKQLYETRQEVLNLQYDKKHLKTIIEIAHEIRRVMNWFYYETRFIQEGQDERIMEIFLTLEEFLTDGIQQIISDNIDEEKGEKYKQAVLDNIELLRKWADEFIRNEELDESKEGHHELVKK